MLRYDGRDGYARATRLTFAPRPARLSRSDARFDVTLAPGAEQDIEVVITPCETRAGDTARRSPCPPTPAAALEHWPARAEAVWLAGTTQVRASSPEPSGGLSGMIQRLPTVAGAEDTGADPDLRRCLPGARSLRAVPQRRFVDSGRR